MIEFMDALTRQVPGNKCGRWGIDAYNTTDVMAMYNMLRLIATNIHTLRQMRRMLQHYSDVIMTTVASQITSLTIVYSIVYSGADQRIHQSSASLAFVRGIHWDRWIPRTKGQLRGKMFPFDDVIMHITVCLRGNIIILKSLFTDSYIDDVGRYPFNQHWLCWITRMI